VDILDEGHVDDFLEAGNAVLVFRDEREQTRNTPPGRGSTSQDATVKPFGPTSARGPALASRP
jgi:hypothetical protein